MRIFLAVVLLLPFTAWSDTTIVPDSDPYFCDVNPDGWFLPTETYSTEAGARARAPVMADEYETDVEVICTKTDRYVYSAPAPEPEPEPEPEPTWDSDCLTWDQGYECPRQQVPTPSGYTEEAHSSGWYIYTQSSEPTPDPDPTPDPTPDPGPAPNPVPSGTWVGVPMPSFGVQETVADSAYTHWVDNSGACTNTGNGTPSNPRCSVPGSLSAGDIVQVRGGPYSEMAVSFNGSAASPAFLRGPAGGHVVFTGREGLTISGQYFVIENVDIARVQSEGSSFYAIRDSLIHEPTPGTGGMIAIADTDAVYLRNDIWGNGSVTDPKDRHGFNIGGAADRIWILENRIHENGGDAIQFCHYCIGAANGGPGAIYIANNVMYGDKENAIDLKEFTGPVIISGNDMSNYFRITSGQGEAIRINDEGNQGEVWMIRNNIHDSNICINPDRSRAQSYAVDNICQNNNYGILDGLTGQGGNVTNGVSDGSPESLYQLFEQRHGIDIRP
tara:strand:+ start:1210 stop:2709 length:1500 start_codon:yes stop_codon:yes gene_type:complete